MTVRPEEFLDEGTFVSRDEDITSPDALRYPDLQDTLLSARERTGSTESVIVGSGRLGGHEVELASFDFGFMGGSMGEATGERLARGLERAADGGIPFVLRTATGGARMQEGMRSLIQMPKVVSARLGLARAGAPLVAVLGHPTTGGVLASLAALADITIAVDGATVGFAGPRVAQSFTGRPLSEDSHTASSALAHGLVDEVVETSDEKQALAKILEVLAPDAPGPVEPPDPASMASDEDAWDVVRAARAEGRLNVADALPGMLDAFFELRGDRSGTDDRAVVGGVGRVAGRRIMALALDRRLSPSAAGFRKARRLVETAGRLGLPIVTLIDTRGADPSEGSEAGGVAWEIAKLFEGLLSAPVPIVSVVTGEGGSGGALAFGAGDVLVAYEHSFFSVIGPEGAAQILWRDPSRAPEAARLLKVSARDLARLGIADRIVPEPLTADSLTRVVAYHLDVVASHGSSREDLATERQRRWRSL